MPDLVRAAALSGYLDVMAELNVDPRPHLKEQGLTLDLLASPEQLIPAQAAFRLLERSATATGCMTLGLRMAEPRSLANLGATSLLIAHQPSLRHALAALAEFRVRINSTLVLSMEPIGDQLVLREDFALREPQSTRQSTNLALGVLARLCQSVLGRHWAPTAVCFTHEAPDRQDVARFVRVFQCQPQFDSEFNGLIIPLHLLDRPNIKADDQLARHARHLLESVMAPSPTSTAQDVDQMVKLLLPAGRATIQTCSASLGLTVRTLQRRLDEEGECFTDILSRARQQLAKQYLTNPRIRITDVADMLGYASIGAFTRWHIKAFGIPPSETRKEAQASAGSPSGHA